MQYHSLTHFHSALWDAAKWFIQELLRWFLGKDNALNWTGRRQSSLLPPWLQASQGAPHICNLVLKGQVLPAALEGGEAGCGRWALCWGIDSVHGGGEGVSSRSSLPWPSCFSPNGPQTPFPPAAVEIKIKDVFSVSPSPSEDSSSWAPSMASSHQLRQDTGSLQGFGRALAPLAGAGPPRVVAEMHQLPSVVQRMGTSSERCLVVH